MKLTSLQLVEKTSRGACPQPLGKPADLIAPPMKGMLHPIEDGPKMSPSSTAVWYAF